MTYTYTWHIMLMLGLMTLTLGYTRTASGCSHLFRQWSTVMSLRSSSSSPPISSVWYSRLVDLYLKQPRCCTASPEQNRNISVEQEHQQRTVVVVDVALRPSPKCRPVLFLPIGVSSISIMLVDSHILRLGTLWFW